MAEHDHDSGHDTASGMVLPENLRDPAQLIDVLNRAGWWPDAQRTGAYVRFVPPEDIRRREPLLVPLDTAAPEFDDMMDIALDTLNRYMHTGEQLRAAAAHVAAASAAFEKPYSDAELKQLRDLYNPQEHGRAGRAGNPFSFEPSPDTAQQAHKWAIREQVRELLANLDANMHYADLRTNLHEMGGSPLREFELKELDHLFFEELEELDRLFIDLDDLRGDLARALSPPLQVGGDHGVQMILDQINGARSDLHDVIDRLANAWRDRTDFLSRENADFDSTSMDYPTDELHQQIDDWASSSRIKTDARAGRAWAMLYRSSLRAREALSAAADTGPATAEPATAEAGTADRRLQPSIQQLVDHVTDAGPSGSTHRPDTPAERDGKAPWAPPLPPAGHREPPMQR